MSTFHKSTQVTNFAASICTTEKNVLSLVPTPAPISYPLTLSVSSLVIKKRSQRKVSTKYFLVVSLSLYNTREHSITGEILVLYSTTTVSICYYVVININSSNCC